MQKPPERNGYPWYHNDESGGTKDLRVEENKDFTQGAVSSPVILNLFSGMSKAGS